MFFSRWLVFWNEKKCFSKSRWKQILTLEKCTVPLKKIDGCKYSLETIIVPLKERIAETNFFGNKHTVAETIAQGTDDCKISLQDKYSIL